MEDKELLKRIHQANDQFVGEGDDPVEVEEEEQLRVAPQVPVDMYRRKSNVMYDEGRKTFPKGATADLAYNIKGAIDGVLGSPGLKARFMIVSRQLENLIHNGEKARVAMLREQYMRDDFLPAIEALVSVSGADLLLNSPEALSELDKYAMVNGGRGNGYTASFIRSLHADELGTTISSTDSYVRMNIAQIRELVQRDQIRSAVGLANKTVEQIEKGNHSASDEDYELLIKVASR